MMKAALVLGVVLVVVLWFVFLAGSTSYPDVDVRDVDRDALFRRTEQLLAESEDWPAALTEPGIVLATSLAPYPVRTVRYAVEFDGDFERAVAYVKNENYNGKTRREKKDKWEETLYERDDDAGRPIAWVRRSVHIAPRPGGNREAVVVYFEDRPDAKTYRIACQSVESLGGKPFPAVEDAVRFKVLPSMYKVEETAPGRVRIRKVEAVDPRGSMSRLMNNYFLSIVFFRSYMFDQAKDMRASLSRPRS
jgi:START domain-containing protein